MVLFTAASSMEDHSPTPLPSPPRTYKLTAASISFTKSTTAIPTTTVTPPFLFKSCTVGPPTYILRDVSLTAYPGQILAVVGPSGAGKSTLLDILAARTSPTSGTLLLNSSPINPSSFRKLSAYVPQHDACIPLLTVSETFAFAASLLISDTSSSTIFAVITSVMAELRLTHLSNTMLSRGLSGGERRRVSIGLSLLHDPGILILDEPTSGLDSKSAYNVIQTIKTIAEGRRRTVVLSIHQPSFKILSCMDRIVLLSKGTVVHHGTMPSLDDYLRSNGFTVPPQLNALEYAMEILSELQEFKTTAPQPTSPSDNSRIITSGDEVRDHANVVVRYKCSRNKAASSNKCTGGTRSWAGAGDNLHQRWVRQGRDTKRLSLFAFTLTFLLSSTTETLPIFINERPILLGETTSGLYRLSSYLIANTLVFLPYLFAVAVIYSISVYFLVGLCGTWQAFSYFVLVIWIVVLMANSFVLCLSSLAPNYIAGTSLVTVLLGGFFLFSGYFISKGSIPSYWVFMHFLSMYKYALDALLINEYSCLASRCLIWYRDGEEDQSSKISTACMVTGRDVMEKRGLHEGMRWFNVYVLIGFFVLYRVLCFMVLIRRISRLRK
ncbi:ATP-binding cassette sub- G member 8 [Dionaea muscipula]